MAALNLAGMGFGAINLAALVHVLETLAGGLASLLGVVGVGDGTLCIAYQYWQ